MTIHLDDWVAREHRGVSHLVESLVAGDVITRCGRRLRDEPTKSGGALVLWRMFDVPKCLACQGPAT